MIHFSTSSTDKHTH